MTAPAPSGPVKRSKRMLAFYVAMGVVLALAVGFYFAWTPLRVSYTIHKIRSAPKTVQSREELLLREERILYCLERASQGHRLAMAAIVEGLTDGSFLVRVEPSVTLNNFHIPDLAYVAARTQPGLFYEELDRRTDEQSLHVLWQICDQSGDSRGLPPGWDHLNFDVHIVRGTSESSPKAMVRLAARLKSASEKATNPNDRGVSKSALDYLRRRFASQLGAAPATESGAQK